MDIQEINDTLDREIEEMQRILEQEARGFISEDSAVQWYGDGHLQKFVLTVLGQGEIDLPTLRRYSGYTNN